VSRSGDGSRRLRLRTRKTIERHARSSANATFAPPGEPPNAIAPSSSLPQLTFVGAPRRTEQPQI